MQSSYLRELYLDFFKSKKHKIVSSAPIVVKDDPTLMFTNAGMNQFKDIFLGDNKAENLRVANSQKCLRVSGKHNDLNQVGHDTYHHTMFEMLGSWSFGDYFKKEAIDWAWEFLTDVCKLDKDRLYVTIFNGDKTDDLLMDRETYDLWHNHVEKEKIIKSNKKDNFWEMGSIGPCGPCSEIHYDNRTEKERLEIKGENLVNTDHPQVIEIWNLVFMQFNRSSNGKLIKLSSTHVDTGMGFERLAMILQGLSSSYDSDIFKPLINSISKRSGYIYGKQEDTDVAMRVIADHIRAISFSIADGQLPSNVKAGYVIRRILRRAVRYAYTFLNIKNPFMYELVDDLAGQLGDHFTEISSQKKLISKVIREEEESFLRTLEGGLKRIHQIISNQDGFISGKEVFDLYDRFGFPVDLTALILSERNLKFNMNEFDEKMLEQKERSRNDSKLEKGDWKILLEDEREEFVGYKYLEIDVKITRYREVKSNTGIQFEIVFNLTPFYPQGGGQIGDVGVIKSKNQNIAVLNTKKENKVILHLVDKLPNNLSDSFIACVDIKIRNSTSRNHTATHLLHQSLRDILGEHITQKGSLVTDKYLRFDFSHFSKLETKDLRNIEANINSKILKNIILEEHIDMPLAKARELGAIMLFGEKYDDVVRMIQFDSSLELCGGTHVNATGEIGVFKILSENSVSSGVRRIEAITGFKSIEHMNNQESLLNNISNLIKNNDINKGIEELIKQNKYLQKEVQTLRKHNILSIKKEILNNSEEINNIKFFSKNVDLSNDEMKNLLFKIRKENKNFIVLLANNNKDKVFLSLMLTDDLVNNGFDACAMMKEISKEINGGGGGQPFFATAGGNNIRGIHKAINKLKELICR